MSESSTAARPAEAPAEAPAPLPEPNPPPVIEKLPPRPSPTMAYSYKEYNPNAKVFYVRDHNVANKVLTSLHPPTGPLGFDLEWRPNFVKGGTDNPVALVQLANESTVMLFQVSAMKVFPSKLIEVLANTAIVKAGVAIQGDAKKLFNDYNVPVRNCVDLTLLARTVDNARWAGKYNSPIGLAHLIQSYEYRLLSKDKTSRSNWEARLDSKQLEYASNDAHAGYILYKRLEAMIPSMPAPPDTTWYSFSIFNGNLCDHRGVSWAATNPNYDPGPPPPPREPTEAQLARKERRNQERQELAKQKGDGSAPENAATPVHSQPAAGSSFSSRQGVQLPRTNLAAQSLQRPAPGPSNSPRAYPPPSQRHGNSPSRGRGSSSHANGRYMPKSSVTRGNFLSHQHQTNSRRGSGPESGRERKDTTVVTTTAPPPRNIRTHGRRPQPRPSFLNRSTMANAPSSSTSTIVPGGTS